MEFLIDILKDPFTYLALLSVFFSVCVVAMKNLFRATVCMAAALCTFAGFYFILDAPFVAVIQVLLYVSAVAALLLFIIMIIKKDSSNRMIRKEENAWKKWQPALLSGFVIVLVVLMLLIFSWSPWQNLPVSNDQLPDNEIPLIGAKFLTEFVLPFELVSLLLFVAVFGAIILARKKDPVAETTPGFDDEVKS